MNDIDLGLAVV